MTSDATGPVTFRCDAYPELTLQDGVPVAAGTGVWADFRGGSFTTSDPDVIARLRKAPDVTEVPR